MTSLLATKLFSVPPRSQRVQRSHLVDRLVQSHRPGHKLTVLAAPAGFGKTTLLGEWLASVQRPTAWLSLDSSDNDPARFLNYMVAALQTLDAGLGADALQRLQSGDPALSESILISLLNDLARLPCEGLLVLDDYHVIDHRPIHDALAFLLDHLPPQLHIALSSRSDPPLPLARWRARGELMELRAADLRFTAAEAADFLNQVMGLSLSAADVAALETRTEGWIAGLQLAALSLRGRSDVSGFIQSFAGDHRFIADYLVEEVLHRQTDTVRQFLLHTSILDRMSGSLCEAVTGQPGGSAQLDALERGLLFVIPLDNRRQWFRYHHLFADVLQAQLRATDPDLVMALQRRASVWHEQNDSITDAIRFAMAGGDITRAADLIERAVPKLQRIRQEASLLSWLQALPADVFLNRPVLSGHFASVILQNGGLEGADNYLSHAERWLEKSAEPQAPNQLSPDKMVVVDQMAFRRLPGWVAVHRSGLALRLGDIDGTQTHAQRALQLVAEDDHLGRGAASALQGLAAWWNGDLDTAYRSYQESRVRMQQAGHLSDALGCSLALADLRGAQGRLRDALHTCQDALKLVEGMSSSRVRGLADMYAAMAEIHFERHDLESARACLAHSRDLGEGLGLPQNPYRWRVVAARLRQSDGDFEGALELLDEAEQRYTSDFSPAVRPIAALKARLWLAQGRVDEAAAWARRRSLSSDDELSYLREYEHLTLARVLAAHGRLTRNDRLLSEALSLLERLLQAAETGGRSGAVIECLMLQALTHFARDDVQTAVLTLDRALQWARAEGYVRLFVDEGAPMVQLAQAATERGLQTGGVGLALARAAPTQPPVAPRSGRVTAPLIEPLSPRELDVLRLMKTELSGPEIAQELVIGLSTVRTYTKSLYGKLGVTNRRAAVERALELRLI